MHYTIPFIVALASLAAALPTLKQREDQWKGVIDPWGLYGRKPENRKRSNIELLEDSSTNSTNFRIAGVEYSPDKLLKLAKRALIEDFVGKIPGCYDDPSNLGTPKPNYAVNQGVRIPKTKGANDDACGSGHNGDHCWTEYYLVEAAVEFFSWAKTGSPVNCSAGPNDSCSSVSTLAQSCTTTGTTSSEGYDWKIIEGSLKLGVNSLKNRVEVAAGGTYSKIWTTTDHHLTKVCQQESPSATCTWNNDSTERRNLCHQLWYADRVMHVWGQAQRVCNKCGNADTVQQQTGDGKVCVRGQEGFDYRLPINKLVFCDGACNSNESGLGSLPDAERSSYIAPAEGHSGY